MCNPVRHAAGLVVLAGLVTACSPGAAGIASHPAAPPSPGRGYAVWVATDAAGNGAPTLTLVDAATGARLRTLEGGVPAADWSVLYRTRPDAGGTRLEAVDPHSGAVLRSLHLPYAVDLPRMDGGGNLAPLTPDAQAVVLEGVTRDARGAVVESTYAVVGVGLAAVPSLISMPGVWHYDGISADGRHLFLLQYSSGAATEYLVRDVDVATGWLDPNVIVAKGESESSMSGTGVARVFLGEWQLTLYAQGPHGAFIHALNLANPGLAICLELNTTGPPRLDGYWSLVATGDGRAVAVNAATGDLATVGVNGIPQLDAATRVAVPHVALAAGTPVACAPLDGAAALSADGRTLYAAAPGGVVTFDVTTATVRGVLATGLSPESLALSRQGELVVVDAKSHTVHAIDLTTGGTDRAVTAPLSRVDAVVHVEAAGG